MSSPAESLQRYYRFQSQIYDATRWSFLFGRKEILEAARRHVTPRRVLEVGCGTGTNLVSLVRMFPEAEITGLDLSVHMLAKARRKLGNRVRLVCGAYGEVEIPGGPFDLVVFSYCLSMVNPGFDKLIGQAIADLENGGAIAIVDFHDTPWGWFRSWMGLNHVRFDGQIQQTLDNIHVSLELCQIKQAYGGLWRYLLCVGVKNSS